ncbi:MAG: PilZ domain-containing protein [Sulfuricella sp.]|nr:PilZ domain-containing protein [Sulfuricella sp.]
MPFAKATFSETQEDTHHGQPRLRVINGGRSAPKGELRKSRRIPIQCKVEIKAQDGWEIHYGVSTDISVDGVSFVTDYVPRFGQLLEIHIVPPQGSPIKPLRALIQVKRCAQVVAGKQYEIGAAIIKIRG